MQAKQDVCETCGGSGWLGGPSFYDPGEGGEPCRDCTGHAQDRPVEPGAISASIQELDAWESRADGELLTPSEGESVILVLHEIKRLRARYRDDQWLGGWNAAIRAAPVPMQGVVGITVDEAKTAQRISALDAYRAAHGSTCDLGFAPDRAWLEGFMYASADSVLEDAARLDWLDQQCGGAYGFEDMHEGNRWEIMGAYANVRQAIDAERAACKQGGSHD